MKKYLLPILAISVAALVIGCTPKEEPTTSGTGTTTEPPKTSSTPAGGTAGTASATDPVANPNAKMVKCEGCGTEMAEASLKDHEGKKLCAKCIEAHGH